MMVEVRVPQEVQALLEVMSDRGRRWTRWILGTNHAATTEIERYVVYAPGTRFQRDGDGLWSALEERPESFAEREPDLAVDADRYARKVDALTPTQGDVDDALKGLEPTPVVTPEGGVRLDYNSIPLKNADGSLTRYAKNLIDLHAPATRAGGEFAGEMVEKLERTEIEKPDGTVVKAPVKVAEPMLREGKVREPRKRKKGKS